MHSRSQEADFRAASIVMLAAVRERAGQRLHLGSMAVVYLISALLLAATDRDGERPLSQS